MASSLPDHPAQTAPRTPRREPGHWPHLVALLATAFTWPLLFIGGLVTTYRVGMAVPDWPTTFGINMFLYDMTSAAWGVLVEHGHRLYGAAVGLGCVILALWFSLASGRRAWIPLALGALVAVGLGILLRLSGQTDPLYVSILTAGPVSLGLAAWFGRSREQGLVAFSWILLAAVIAQGALGGLRVRLNSTDLAALHGCTGQLFFAAMVVLCVLTGSIWNAPKPRAIDPAGLRSKSAAFAVLVYIQIVAGAWLRHYSLGLTIHTALAIAVFIGAHLVAIPALRLRSTRPELAPSARTLLILTAAQLALGILSWWLLRPFDGLPKDVSPGQALVRTAHQANGALVLAAAVVLSLRSSRHLAASRVSGYSSTIVAKPAAPAASS